MWRQLTLIFCSIALISGSRWIVDPTAQRVRAEPDIAPSLTERFPEIGEFEPGRILIKMAEESDSDPESNYLLGHPVLMRIPRLGVHVLEVEEGQEVVTAAALSARSDVEYVEPDYIYRISASSSRAEVQPSDPLIYRTVGPHSNQCTGGMDPYPRDSRNCDRRG